MSFDPYYEWMGIAPDEQPPHYYRLLGLSIFESNPTVIENAADRQMAHLRRKQNGPQAEIAQRILNEISAARVALLNADRKSAYDEHLMMQLGGIGCDKPPFDDNEIVPLIAVESVANMPNQPAAPRSKVAPNATYVAPAAPTAERRSSTATKLKKGRPTTAATVLQFVQIGFGGVAGIAVAILVLKLAFKTDPLGLFEDKTQVAQATSASSATSPKTPSDLPPPPNTPPTHPSTQNAGPTIPKSTKSSPERTGLPSSPENAGPNKAPNSPAPSSVPTPDPPRSSTNSSTPPSIPSLTPDTEPSKPSTLSPTRETAEPSSQEPEPEPPPPPAPAVAAIPDVLTLDFVSLPIRSPSESEGENNSPVMIGTLKSSDPSSVPQLKLHSDFTRLKAGESLELVAREKEGIWRWIVAYYNNPEKKDPQRAAEFRLEEGILKFVWGTNVATQVVEQLRNCLLTISHGDQAKELSLRGPVQVPAITLNLEAKRDARQFELDSLPKVDDVFMEIVRVEGPGQPKVESKRPHCNLGEKVRVDFDDHPECWINVGLSRRGADSLTVTLEALYSLTARKEASLSIPELADLRDDLPKRKAKLVRDMAAASAKAETAATMARNAAAGTPAKVTAMQTATSQTNNARKLGEQIQEAEATYKALDKYDNIAKKLHDQTRIYVRIVAKNDSRRIVLLETTGS